METTNKYYTPTIEEFHIGFECEKTGLDGLELPPQWHEYVVNFNTFNEPLFKGKDKIGPAFRVKYLDKEDIESFGFKCIEENEDGSFYKYSKDSYNNSKIILDHFIWTTGIDDVFTEHRKIKIYRTGGEPITFRYNSTEEKLPIDRDMLSLSIVKNKSELKILLKQLGIE